MSSEIESAVRRAMEDIKEALGHLHGEKELHSHEIVIRKAKIEAIEDAEIALRRRMSEVEYDLRDGKYFSNSKEE